MSKQVAAATTRFHRQRKTGICLELGWSPVEEVGRQMEPGKLKKKNNEELYATSLHLLSKSVSPLIAGNGEMYGEIRSFRLIPLPQLQLMSLSILPLLARS